MASTIAECLGKYILIRKIVGLIPEIASKIFLKISLGGFRSLGKPILNSEFA